MLRLDDLKKYIEPLIHMIIWGSFFYFQWSTTITLGPFRKVDGSIYPPLLWSLACNLIIFYFNALYLIPRLISKQRYGLYILWATILYASVVLLNSVLDHFYSISLFSSEKEPLFSEVYLNFASKLIIFSLSLGYGLTKNWMSNEKLRQQLVRDKLATELKYLKAQINPHFLFNTLNMAYASSIKSNDSITADIIEKLSGLMRYVLYEGNEELVMLDKEIEYINNYIALQLKRLSAELAAQFKYEATGNWQNYKIAPMVLIPFIENVFKHGIMLSKKPEMSISISLKSNLLVLETRNIKNNNPATVKLGSGIGLKNAKERLMLLYPHKHQLEIRDEDNIFHLNLEIQLKPIRL